MRDGRCALPLQWHVATQEAVLRRGRPLAAGLPHEVAAPLLPSRRGPRRGCLLAAKRPSARLPSSLAARRKQPRWQHGTRRTGIQTSGRQMGAKWGKVRGPLRRRLVRRRLQQQRKRAAAASRRRRRSQQQQPLKRPWRRLRSSCGRAARGRPGWAQRRARSGSALRRRRRRLVVLPRQGQQLQLWRSGWRRGSGWRPLQDRSWWPSPRRRTRPRRKRRGRPASRQRQLRPPSLSLSLSLSLSVSLTPRSRRRRHWGRRWWWRSCPANHKYKWRASLATSS